MCHGKGEGVRGEGGEVDWHGDWFCIILKGCHQDKVEESMEPQTGAWLAGLVRELKQQWPILPIYQRRESKAEIAGGKYTDKSRIFHSDEFLGEKTGN